MKKRRKHQQQPSAQGASPLSAEDGAAPETGMEAWEAELEELQAGELNMLTSAENAAEDAADPAKGEAVEMPEFEAAGVESRAGRDKAEAPEAMDELLAELLALDLDSAGPAVELTAVDSPPQEAAEAEFLLAMEEPPAPLNLEAVASTEEPVSEDLDLAPPEPFVEAAEVEATQEEPEAELPGQELLAAEPELSHTELLSEEPQLAGEPSLLEPAAWMEVPSFDTAEMTQEPEEWLDPLPPQPALEAVVGTIDRALESAPAVIAPVETPATHHKQFSQLDDYIVFSLSGSDYAVPVRDVAEIGRIPGVTRVPNVPDFVRGITNLRGEVVPVLNLPALLGLQDSAPTARGRIVFLQAREPISPTGLIVDEVKGIQRIQSQQLEQVTGLVDDKVTSVLRGVHGRGERLLNVLDVEQLFQLEEVRELAIR